MRTAHPREQLGNRLICDSLAISYSRDIDDTIAEEDEEDDDGDDGDRNRDRNRDDDDEEAGTDQQDDDGDEDAMSNGHAALLEQVVIGGGGQNRRSSSRSSRGKSRSVSPGSRANRGQMPQHHDYVNSAPGTRFLEDTTSTTIPAIPPPPQSRLHKQQFFSVQPVTVPTTGDSDPYGKEFDAIGSRVPATAANPSSTGSRINGRVIPPAQLPEVRKELAAASIPPRLRNGFVPSGSGGV